MNLFTPFCFLNRLELFGPVVTPARATLKPCCVTPVIDSVNNLSQAMVASRDEWRVIRAWVDVDSTTAM